MTYGEIWEYSKHVATNLLKHDFEAGACLAVCCLNTSDLVPVILGVWRLSGHVCFINPLESIGRYPLIASFIGSTLANV